MRQVTRKGLITMAAAGGVLALSGGYAHADAGAASTATGSPGVLSGNSVSVPIDIPVNVCGNSVTVGGLINPTFGNDCENGSAQSRQDSGPQNRIGGSGEGAQAGNGAQGGNVAQAGNTTATDRHGEPGTGRHRAGGASAEGVAQGSPGILSGNAIQAPVSVPVNVCGNSVSVIGLLNPTFGNSCSNDAEPPPPPPPPVKPPVTPETPVDPPVEPPANQPPEPNVPGPQLEPEEQLAQTGAGGMEMLIPASAGLLLAGMGSVLYRRSRSAA